MKTNKLIQEVENYYLHLQSIYNEKLNSLDEYLSSYKTYVSLYNEIGTLNYDIAKASYQKDSLQEKILNEKLKIANEKLNSFYSEINYNEIRSKIKYKCNLCKDTGYYKNSRCRCYYKYLTKFAFEHLNLDERKLEKFSQKIPDDLNKHYALIEKYAEKFPQVEVKNFIFTGSVGTGKTHLAKCLAHEVNKKGFLSIFLTSIELNSIFLKMHLSEIDKTTVFEILSSCDLLVIDDLGTEPMYNNVTKEYLLSLISSRLDKSKAFVITTNLTAGELLDRYNERFVSRISNKQETRFIPFNGIDLRRTKF